jgi:tetratricopeptide (TPR) repeat protein
MSSPSASSPVELEVLRIRELSKSGRHAEALAAAETLALRAPEHQDVLYLIAANLRCLKRIPEALGILERLEQHHPSLSLLYQERGHCYTTLRDAPRAIEAFKRAVELNPALETSWRMLEHLYRMTGDAKKAANAATGYLRWLIDRQQYLQAREAAGALLKLEPANPHYLSVYAAACTGLGQHATAIEVYRQLLAALPESAHGAAELRVSLGNCLKSAGRQKEAIESYQTAAAIRPGFGDAWWSLANLKTYRFSREAIAQMRAQEAAPGADPADRYHLCFALGKTYEDRGEYAESWQFYERGNRLKRAESPYHPEIAESNARQQIEVCTTQFFAERAGVGMLDPDPIFIVGLPRSGSTLLEQILASHSQVEGTQELYELQRIADEIGGAGWIHRLMPEDFRRLGQRYLNATRAYRKDKPFFIDKMPNNFRYIGLIHLMLPNARIIDARREPMACCFSNLKQLFASGQEFTYSVEDIAGYYRTYLELMRHWEAVLPGRVLRVLYEDIVADLAGNVKRILEFRGLEFEPACVEFYKTDRNVHTASSEQVRQPIFREGLFQWRNYERWLGPLREALGDAVIRYRNCDVPEEQRFRTVRYTE